MINLLLYQILVCNTHGKYKKVIQKESISTRNEKFDLPDRSCSVPQIQDYFEYIFKKHGEKTDSLSIRIYVSQIENRITFRTKTVLSKPFNARND